MKQKNSGGIVLLLALLSSATAIVPHLPVVWTIAGSDSGGGAGIQADLPTFRDFGCHGCSVVTALTAQNSLGVRHVQSATAVSILAQIEALADDLPADAVKIGMVGNAEAAHAIADGLEKFLAARPGKAVAVVLDPVLVATSGARLSDGCALDALLNRLGPLATLVTPNLIEAEVLLGLDPGALQNASRHVVEEAAKALLQRMKCGAVVIKGGHASGSGNSFASDVLVSQAAHPGELAASAALLEAQSEGEGEEEEAELTAPATATRAVWLSSARVASPHTHGTGCTLSSACAASLAKGSAVGCDDVLDALVLAKGYVSQGIADARAVGKGPGPVAHTGFPTWRPPVVSSSAVETTAHYSSLPVVEFPSLPASLAPAPASLTGGLDEAGGRLVFAKCQDGAAHFELYPIVASAEWVEKLARLGAKDVQLRIKTKDAASLSAEVARAQAACLRHGCRLWVNDHWALAVAHNTYGCHVGQTDLADGSVGRDGLAAIAAAGVRLGVSTATATELAGALHLSPSYIALGPLFTTRSKDSEYDPRGPALMRAWRHLMPPDMPLVGIGGIDLSNAQHVLEQGSMQANDSALPGIAVISAITSADDTEAAMREWQVLWQ